ncbi:MAG: hypothetical protein FWE70_07555, partial [Oscillospiraceae bacterium]|nr:hypothetical protein [Oscillospiraceae bacterium]
AYLFLIGHSERASSYGSSPGRPDDGGWASQSDGATPLGSAPTAQDPPRGRSFVDAGEAAPGLTPMLDYIYDHAELGILGTPGGLFMPNAPVTAQMAYSVMLLSLGYAMDAGSSPGTGLGSFAYGGYEPFLRAIGLTARYGRQTALTFGMMGEIICDALGARMRDYAHIGDTLALRLADGNPVARKALEAAGYCGRIRHVLDSTAMLPVGPGEPYEGFALRLKEVRFRAYDDRGFIRSVAADWHMPGKGAWEGGGPIAEVLGSLGDGKKVKAELRLIPEEFGILGVLSGYSLRQVTIILNAPIDPGSLRANASVRIEPGGRIKALHVEPDMSTVHVEFHESLEGGGAYRLILDDVALYSGDGAGDVPYGLAVSSSVSLTAGDEVEPCLIDATFLNPSTLRLTFNEPLDMWGDLPTGKVWEEILIDGSHAVGTLGGFGDGRGFTLDLIGALDPGTHMIEVRDARDHAGLTADCMAYATLARDDSAPFVVAAEVLDRHHVKVTLSKAVKSGRVMLEGHEYALSAKDATWVSPRLNAPLEASSIAGLTLGVSELEDFYGNVFYSDWQPFGFTAMMDRVRPHPTVSVLRGNVLRVSFGKPVEGAADPSDPGYPYSAANPATYSLLSASGDALPYAPKVTAEVGGTFLVDFGGAFDGDGSAERYSVSIGSVRDETVLQNRSDATLIQFTGYGASPKVSDSAYIVGQEGGFLRIRVVFGTVPDAGLAGDAHGYAVCAEGLPASFGDPADGTPADGYFNLPHGYVRLSDLDGAGVTLDASGEWALLKVPETVGGATLTADKGSLALLAAADAQGAPIAGADNQELALRALTELSIEAYLTDNRTICVRTDRPLTKETAEVASNWLLAAVGPSGLPSGNLSVVSATVSETDDRLVVLTVGGAMTPDGYADVGGAMGAVKLYAKPKSIRDHYHSYVETDWDSKKTITIHDMARPSVASAVRDPRGRSLRITFDELFLWSADADTLMSEITLTDLTQTSAYDIRLGLYAGIDGTPTYWPSKGDAGSPIILNEITISGLNPESSYGLRIGFRGGIRDLSSLLFEACNRLFPYEAIV